MALAQSLDLGNLSLQLPGPGKAPLFLTLVRMWVNSSPLCAETVGQAWNGGWPPSTAPSCRCHQPASSVSGGRPPTPMRPAQAAGACRPAPLSRVERGRQRALQGDRLGAPGYAPYHAPGQDLASPWLQSVCPAGGPMTSLGPFCPCSPWSQPRSWAASLSRPWSAGMPVRLPAPGDVHVCGMDFPSSHKAPGRR